MLDTNRSWICSTSIAPRELHGGLISARSRSRTRPQLVLALTRHSAEEVVHAAVLDRDDVRLGGVPAPYATPIRTGTRARYAATVVSLFHVLALTQVFERRVFRHFTPASATSRDHPAFAPRFAACSMRERDHLPG